MSWILKRRTEYDEIKYGVETKTLNSQRVLDVNITTSDGCCWPLLIDIATLRQLCEQHQVDNSYYHGSRKVVKKILITTWHLSGMQDRHCDLKFRILFPYHTLKFPMINDKFGSCNLKLSKKYCFALDFLSIFKRTSF